MKAEDIIQAIQSATSPPPATIPTPFGLVGINADTAAVAASTMNQKLLNLVAWGRVQKLKLQLAHSITTGDTYIIFPVD